MATGILILIPVAGYIFLVRFPHTRYHGAHWSDYNLLFPSFAVGILLVSAAAVSHYVFDEIFFPQFEQQFEWFKRARGEVRAFLFFYVHDAANAKYLTVIFLSLAQAFLLPIMYEAPLLIRQNKRQLHVNLATKAAERKGELVEAALAKAIPSVLESYTFAEAVAKGKAMELLLEDDLVHIGIVEESSITAASKDTAIKLQLMARGYWDKTTGEFIHVKNAVAETPTVPSTIVIPVSKIVSARVINLHSDEE